MVSRKAVLVLWLSALLLCICGTARAGDRKTKATVSHFIMAGVYERLGRVDEAIDEYKKALSSDPANAAIHSGLASAYLKKNDVAKAIEELNLAVKYEPGSVEPHAVLALLYFSQDKLTEAGKEYEAALENASRLEPENAAIYKRLGLLYLQQKNYAAAEKTYRLLLELSAEDAESRFFLSNVLDEQKRREEAVEQLKKVIESDPAYHQALNYLGYVYVEDNRNLAEAEELIKRALAIEPDNGAYIDSLGWLFFKKGKYKEALAQLTRAASLLEDPVIFDHLGDVYQKLKDTEKARQSWEKSLSISPEQPAVRKKLEALPAKK